MRKYDMKILANGKYIDYKGRLQFARFKNKKIIVLIHDLCTYAILYEVCNVKRKVCKNKMQNKSRTYHVKSMTCLSGSFKTILNSENPISKPFFGS